MDNDYLDVMSLNLCAYQFNITFFNKNKTRPELKSYTCIDDNDAISENLYTHNIMFSYHSGTTTLGIIIFEIYSNTCLDTIFDFTII